MKNPKKMKYYQILLVLLFVLTSCVQKSNIERKSNAISSIIYPESFSNPTIICGEIRNLNVYPNIKDIKLTIPGFEGSKIIYVTKIDSLAKFYFKIYPKTKREINLFPIEDILIVEPGDSIYIVKDFKDIGNTTFYGNGAELNQQICKFHNQYLGRYPSNYNLSYNDFKASCEEERKNIYARLKEFKNSYKTSEYFNNWATKQIELDFCKALFHYPFQHFLRTKEVLVDTTHYYSFIKNLEDNIDNSLVLSDYFEVSRELLFHQISTFKQKNGGEIKNGDAITVQQFNSISNGITNTYLNQLLLGSLVNMNLNSNDTVFYSSNKIQISEIINDPFLFNALAEKYDKVKGFRDNPKPFTDALLTTNDREVNRKNISVVPGNDINIVKDIIKANPGKVVFINFWAPWCAPCIEEIPFTNQLIADFKEENIEFVFVSIHTNKKLWEATIKEQNYGGTHLFCNEEETREVWKRFGLKGIPYFILINKRGEIADFGEHLTPKHSLVKNQITKLLEE
jgi:thiol-disulfide isomerase/thioredoxin